MTVSYHLSHGITHTHVCLSGLLAFCPTDVRIGFTETALTVAEDAGPASLTVAVLEGGLGTSVYVNLSTIDGTALGAHSVTSVSFAVMIVV